MYGLWRYGMALNCLTSQQKSGNQTLHRIARPWRAPGELFLGQYNRYHWRDSMGDCLV